MGKDPFAESGEGSAKPEEPKRDEHPVKAPIDTLVGNLTAQDPAPVTDAVGTLLDNMASAGGTATGGPAPTAVEFGKSFAGDKTDWILGAGSAASTKIFDGVAELTRKAGPENKWVGKLAEEVKLFGTEVKGSRLGILPSLAFGGAAFAENTGQDHMPPLHSFIREGASLIGGTAGSLTPGGVVLGIAAGNASAKLVDTFSYMGKGVAEAGGAGEVMKVARWGWAP